ncbi:MAG: class I SAM-dependent methyltransferase [Gaiellaceae bacterium MAG52_C11]|nr:class I SAM-dependent methyltransferase [Candidatus Gaiellasilicea maunaloa]
MGSGALPAISRAELPAKSNYVGLDISAAELGKAPVGAYDETIVADAATALPELRRSFDLVVSWQVLEHVESTEPVVANVRSYLDAGGSFVAMLSGGLSPFALINRLVPQEFGRQLLERLTGREPVTVFPAHYDRCTYRGLERVFSRWSDLEIQCYYRGAGYFRFNPVVQAAYLALEDRLEHARSRRFATHYLVQAIR